MLKSDIDDQWPGLVLALVLSLLGSIVIIAQRCRRKREPRLQDRLNSAILERLK